MWRSHNPSDLWEMHNCMEIKLHEYMHHLPCLTSFPSNFGGTVTCILSFYFLLSNIDGYFHELIILENSLLATMRKIYITKWFIFQLLFSLWVSENWTFKNWLYQPLVTLVISINSFSSLLIWITTVLAGLRASNYPAHWLILEKSFCH